MDDAAHRLKELVETEYRQSLPLGVDMMSNVTMDSAVDEDGGVTITVRARIMGHGLTGLQAMKRSIDDAADH